MENLIGNLQGLVKALEGGQQGGFPGSQTQGSALQIEDLSPVIQNVCWKEDIIKLQKVIKVESCKSTLAQFDRQLDYGQFGGSAQLEGAVGQEETSSIIRVVVPMAFYSHLRRTTVVANLVETVDGKKADERAAEDAAKKIAMDVEYDIFRGYADFSNAGVFDGNPLAVPALPNIHGVDIQVRASDYQFNSHDLMLEEFGSNLSIVLTGGGVLTQSVVEDAHVRSQMNMGEAKDLYVDPLVASAYNKTLIGAVNGAFAPIGQRMMAGGSAVDVSGADLSRQYVHGGVVKIETSRFLSGKTTWARARTTSPSAPTVGAGALTDYGATVAGALATGTYRYIVTACNEAGESAPFGLGGDTAGIHKVAITGPTGSARLIITNVTAKFYNIYRSAAGAGTKAVNFRFIGRVVAASGGTTTFLDLGNRLPGFVTGFLLQPDTMGIKELSPYSRLKLAVSDLSTPEAHFRFLTLACFQPRKNVIVDNLVGAL
jgi:hypothetical protein